MQGKICLVTGATNGIGKITALALAHKGATVVVVGRSISKTEETVSQIKAQTNNESVLGMIADLSLMEHVRNLAAEFKSKFSQLDVLVNNAGAVFGQRLQTAEGLEMTFALNHLSYFLLTNLLLPELQAAARVLGKMARVINVSSSAHFGGSLNFDDLQGKRRYASWQAYAQSKLMNVLFTYELSRRQNANGISANVVHPGLVASGFGKNNGTLLRMLFTVLTPFSLSAEQGAVTPIYLATSPDIEAVTGKYFDNRKATKSSFASYDEAAARRLWQISEQLTGIAQMA